MNLPDLTIDADRALVAKHGLVAFTRLAFPVMEPGARGYTHGRHIEVVGKFAEDFFAGRRGDCAVFLPPVHMKSRICSVAGPAHALIGNPGFRLCSVSYNEDMARELSELTLSLVTSPWYQERWPHVKVPAGQAAADWSTTAGGRRLAVGVEQGITGKHFDCIVCDDLIKAQGATPAAFATAETFWRNARPSRFRTPAEGRTLLVMQRLSTQDPGALAEADDYEILRLPARFEANTPDPLDWRTEEGQILWPERFGVDGHVLDRIQKPMTEYVKAGQYQMRPFPEGGGMFREEHLQVWPALPPRFDRMVIAVDCAFSSKQTADFTCAQLWGRKGRDHYLIGQFRGHVGVKETAVAIRSLVRSHPQASLAAIVVEQAANGEAVIERLKEAGVSRVQGVKPKGGKELRAAAALPLFESGEVWLAPAPWLPDFKAELLAFPNGRNDDQIDAMGHALAYLAVNNRDDLVHAMQVAAQQRNPGAIFGAGSHPYDLGFDPSSSWSGGEF